MMFVTTLFNSKLNAHPYKLITWITLIDASYVMIFVFYGRMCEMELPEVFTYTVIYPIFYLSYGIQLTQEELWDWQVYSLLVLESFGRWLFTGFILLSLLLNTFLCLDLYLTVKNPFAKSSGRSVSCGSITVILSLSLLGCLLLYLMPNLFWKEVAMIFVGFFVFVVIAVFTIILTTKRLLKPGFSKQVRRRVLLRQIRYILTIALVFLVFFASKSIQLDAHHMFWINFVGTLLLCSLGFILSLYRLSEPLVWKTLKDKLMYVLSCGRRQPEADSIEEADTLTTFLATSYNVELVYIILKGITSFSKEQHRIDQGSKKPGKSNIKRAVSNSQI